MNSARGKKELRDNFISAVRAGLLKPNQKELPSSYFYDELGSALFDACTFLPEYGVTRAEGRLLNSHARTIASLCPQVGSVVELGSGNGSKTRALLDAFAGDGPLEYFPIDVSENALACCKRELADIPLVRVVPLNMAYLDGLNHPALARSDGRRRLVLFLGSTIGNFHRQEAASFLREIRNSLKTGDGLLLGADLEKPASVLIPAYDDPTGVTAAFNRNLLGHANRVLGADFDLRSFVHEVRFDETERRIEMHLRSTRDQVVNIPAAELRVQLRRDETLWTEWCYRYNPTELRNLALHSGFEEIGIWTDQDWEFASTLWIVKEQ